MPSGPGVIGDQLISEIAASITPPISTFLLTAFQEADAIIDQHHVCRTSTIQLVDRVEPGELQKLRKQLPGIKLVQVIHVTDTSSIEEAIVASKVVDVLLLDSGNQELDTKQLGGTGRTHDWKLSRRIRDEINIPLFLAGGLNAANVADAIREVHPYGLDLCSGVRTDGKLDTTRLREFVEAVGRSTPGT